MKIAIFDYRIIPNNPIGSCHRHILSALCEEHDFTVFAPQFDNPRPDRVKHVAVKVLLRPLALLFLTFHLNAKRAWRRYRRDVGREIDLVQSVESNYLGSGVVYAQFCHRAYLKTLGSFSLRTMRSPRAFFGRLDHQLHAWMEPAVYRTSAKIVVPSSGLARELLCEYPKLQGRITVIPNPIDVEGFRRPENFDRAGFRRDLGLDDQDIVLVFTALGHFERKGLLLVMEAMAQMRQTALRLVVVGGAASLIADYRQRAAALGLARQLVFFGRQARVQQFLWAADAFIFPSAYETFSLSSYEAAAAGLPLIVTCLHGVEDFAQHTLNSFIVDRTVSGVRAGLEQLAGLSPERREMMGRHGQDAVSAYTADRFLAAWANFYRDIDGELQQRTALAKSEAARK